MKRILALIMVMMMALPIFASCGGGGGSKPATSSQKPAVSQSTGSQGDSNANMNSSFDEFGGGSQTTTSGFNYEDYRVTDSDYNRNLFYYNELKFEVADPTVIYINDVNSTEYGYFYAYGTSDQIGCHGFQAWRSKDMTNWEDMGPVYLPDFNNNWAYTNYWAPEIIYDATGMVIGGETYNYFMFFNAEKYDPNVNFVSGDREGLTTQHLSVLYAKEPNGPFYHPNDVKNADNKTLSVSAPAFDFSFANSSISSEFQCKNVIDASPFVDPDTGDKYLYYSGWGSTRVGSGSQCIYGVKMKDWLTPDYSTVNLITQTHRMTVDGPLVDHEGRQAGGWVNEGPFMIKRNGTYMMTFSVYPYTDVNYQVRLATSTNPLANFTKLDPHNGGTVIKTIIEWQGIVQSAGHHSLIEVGDEVYIAYHTYKNRTSHTNGRALAIDKVEFVNHNGQEIMYVNGPTYGYQALPEEVSGYENIARDKTITTISSSTSLVSGNISSLQDGLIKYHTSGEIGDIAQDVEFTKGTKLTINFSDYQNVRAVMLHLPNDWDYALNQSYSAKITYKSTSGDKTVSVSDIKYDYNKYYNNDFEAAYPGGTAILEFAELPVKKIELTLNGWGSNTFKLCEVMVLANKDNKTITGVSDAQLKQPYTYRNADVPPIKKYVVGETIGSSIANGTSFHTTFGVDVTNDTATTKSIKTMGPRDQFAYLKDVSGDVIYFEGYINVYASASYMGDQYPKLGLFAKNATACTFFYIDAYNNYTNKAVGYTQSKIGGGDWDWGTTEVTKNAPLIKYKGAEGYTKLAMVRVDNYFKFYVNDVLFFESAEQRGMQDEKDAVYGFLCFNSGMEVKDYSYTTDRTAVNAKIEELALNTPVQVNGATFGSIEGNDLVQSSVTWDLSKDYPTDNVHYADREAVLDATDGDNFLYFINESSNTLYAEATFEVTKTLAVDNWPKFGLQFKNTEGNGILFFADCALASPTIVSSPADIVGSSYGWVTRDASINDYKWGTEVKTPDGKFDATTATKLAVYRQGSIYKFIVNDEVVFEVACSLGSSMYPAIVSFNVGLKVTDYRITSDANDEMMKKYHVETSTEDGSLSNMTFGDANTNIKQEGTWVTGLGSGTSSGAGTAYTWANSLGGKNFYFEADIMAGDPINGDEFPKVGLVLRSSTTELLFGIDAINTGAYGTNKWVSYVTRDITGSYGEWTNQFVTVPTMNYVGGLAAKMGIWYNKGQIYMTVNGNVVLQVKDIPGLSGDDTDVYVGVAGWGMQFSFKNALAKAEEENLTQLAKDLGIVDGDITVDGYLTDWKGSKASFYEARTTDGTKKGFKVMSYMGTKGVYVAYEALAATATTTNTTEWWNNVNGEMRIFKSDNSFVNVHAALNGKAAERVENCYLFNYRIVKGSDNLNTITMEIFIPYSTIGYTGTEEYVAGFFAFKSGTEVLTGVNAGGAESGDWWFGTVHPHQQSYEAASTTYKITANGLVGTSITAVS